MQVTFQPTGEVMNTDLVTQQKGPSSPTLTLPVIGNDGWGGPLTSGSLQAQVGGSGGNYIAWKDHNTESTRSLWPMDDAAAVTLGLANIATSLNDGTLFAITMESDGSLSS